MHMGRFLRQLHRVVSDEQLLRRGDGVVAAVSGGPDSIALLHGLAGLNQAYDWNLRLHAAHLNHQTRGAESDADAQFVVEQGRVLGVPVTVESIDVPAQATPGSGGFESVARKVRYDFLARVADENNCRIVATGHHADDNAETILQRIIRGTGPRGLAGIPAVRPLAPGATLGNGQPIQLVRPLLQFRRRLILRLLETNGIGYRTDASNLAVEPTRNWLRHKLIPQLSEEVNPGVVGSLLRLGELSRWVNVFVEETARRTLTSLIVDRTDQTLSLNAAALGKKRRILQAEVIRQAIMSLGPGEIEVSLHHLKAVMRLAGEDGHGKMVNLPGHVVAERQDGQLRLFRSPQENDAAYRVATLLGGSLVVNMPGETVLPLLGQKLRIAIQENAEGSLESFRRNKSDHEELVDAEKLRPPLLVRAWQPGDRFWPLGAPGTKKVGDFMTDQKVRPFDRGRVLLLCDQLGPVWVMPLRIDDRVRVRPATRMLARITLAKDEG